MIQTAIYVGYTFPTGDNFEIEQNLKMIEKASLEILPNRFKEMAYGKTEAEAEIIYKIDLPLLDNDMEKVRLFRAIKEIFAATASLEPYFCSFDAKAAEKARKENDR